MSTHIFYYVLNCDVHGILNYALVQVANDVLDDSELLEKFAACVKNFMREHIFFTIDPQVGESFLC